MRLFGVTLRTGIVRTIILAIAVSLAACGTILHPERKGQRGGEIDAGIAVLDAVGLLFFIIPGVIAFAVDFSNGTIYLPHGHRSRLDDPDKYTRIHIDGKMDRAAIEKAIRAETGLAVDMSQPDVEVVKLESPADMEARFAQYRAGSRLALAR